MYKANSAVVTDIICIFDISDWAFTKKRKVYYIWQNVCALLLD